MKNSTLAAEIKRNLLGTLEVALFMPLARKRFGDTPEEAVRSFAVPLILFPLTLIAISLYPEKGLAEHSIDMVSTMYTLRLAVVWAIFFGVVYWIVKEIDRKAYFYQFVTASNWLAVPATAIFIPVGWMLATGAYEWEELQPFMNCLMAYTYGFTAFMASRILRIPWELGAFIVFINMGVNDSTLDILCWMGEKL